MPRTPAADAFDPGPTMLNPAGRRLIEIDERVPKGTFVVLDPQLRLEAELRAKMIVADENARDAREAYERAVQRRQQQS